MKIVVLFTCFNRKQKTETCIRTISENNPKLSLSYMVVNDGSNDGTTQLLQDMSVEGYDIYTIDSGGNQYYSGSMRIGMEFLKRSKRRDYDYLLMVNDDVTFYDHTIEQLIEENKKGENIVNVGVTCNSEGAYTYGAIKYDKGIKYHGVGIEYPMLECDTFNANCVLIPYHVFLENENIDSHYVHSLGDFDYGLALKRAGNKIYPSSFYVGVCENNSQKGTWGDRNLSRKERFTRKESPKGLPWKIWFYYIKKNFGVRLALEKLVTSYVKIILRG